MTVLLCVLVSGAAIWFFAPVIRRYDLMFYFAAMAFAVEGLVRTVLDAHAYDILYPAGLAQFMDVVQKGTLAAAIFIWVMVAGALPQASLMRRKIMRCRGELAIMASYLLLPHIAYYSVDFIVGWSRLSKMSGLALWGVVNGFISGAVAFFIMVPLFITSFRRIRKKFAAKRWKALQEYAYIFYALIYIHVLAEWLAKPVDARDGAALAVYSFCFGCYLVLRVKRVFTKRYVRRTQELKEG